MLAVLSLAMAVAGCANNAASQSATNGSAPSASPGVAASTTGPTGIAAIDVPPTIPRMSAHSRAHGQRMTGACTHRQVGDCVWWFGTDVADIDPGKTAQQGFANVAAGRVDGTEIELEWADVPLGDSLGGGGLTVVSTRVATRCGSPRTAVPGEWRELLHAHPSERNTRREPERFGDAVVVMEWLSGPEPQLIGPSVSSRPRPRSGGRTPCHHDRPREA